tara:strand:- start:6 stop:194 length:189 start_codon:yes stop_codon:yes gene_type:complete
MHFWVPVNQKNGNFRVFFGIKAQKFSKMGNIGQVSYDISLKGTTYHEKKAFAESKSLKPDQN